MFGCATSLSAFLPNAPTVRRLQCRRANFVLQAHRSTEAQGFGVGPYGKPFRMSQWRGPHNRRTAARVRLNGTQLSWAPILENKRFGGNPKVSIATLFDLSLRGARVRAPYDRHIVVGTRIRLAAGGGAGIAEVRRINAEDHPQEASYGIQFVHIEAPLLGLFNDTLAAHGLQAQLPAQGERSLRPSQ